MIKFNILDFKKYEEEVRRKTEKVVNLVDGFNQNKRGLSGMTGSFQIDHIIPIRKAFIEGISSDQVSNISNLQFISWEDNNKRRDFKNKLSFSKILIDNNNPSLGKVKIKIGDIQYNYYIHSNGIIENKKGRKLRWNLKSNGYLYINLYNNGLRKTITVHRLVALNFIPNLENKKEVNHIDGNKLNNDYSNLEWVTPSENQLHSYRIGLGTHVGVKNTQSKLTEVDVFEIRSSKLSRIELSIKYKVSKSHIDRILRKENWKHI